MARPSKLTPARLKIILDAVTDGLSRAETAQIAGISTSTLYDWIRQGEDELENTEPVDPTRYTKADLLTLAAERNVEIRSSWTKTRIAEQITAEGRTRFSELSEGLRAREAEFELEALRKISSLGLREGDWRAFAWLLERKYPDRYGRSSRGDSTAGELSGSAEEARAAVERSREIRVKLADVLPLRR